MLNYLTVYDGSIYSNSFIYLFIMYVTTRSNYTTISYSGLRSLTKNFSRTERTLPLDQMVIRIAVYQLFNNNNNNNKTQI